MNYRETWLRQIRHLASEEILLFLDGELSSRRHRAAARHLEGCWPCRLRRDQIQNSISEALETRLASFDSPPAGWDEFPRRLHRVTTQEVCERPGPSLRRSTVIRFSAVAAAAAAFCVWLIRGPVEQLSAKEVLQRTEQSESTRAVGIASPVVYQKLRVRRQGASAEIEIWRDRENGRTHTRAKHPLTAEFAAVLTANSLDPEQPLSPARFERWLNAIEKDEQAVNMSRLDDGSETVVVRTLSAEPHREGKIFEAQFVVRTADWHPVAETLRVQHRDGVREYDVREVETTLAALESIDPAIFGTPIVPEPHPALASQPREIAPLASLPEVKPTGDALVLEDAELRAWFALHQAKACLGEPIEVLRSVEGRILVRGLAESAARRDEIATALSGLGLVDIELTTLQEMSASPAAASDSADAIRVVAAKLPVESLLPEWDKKRISQMADTAVSEADAALAEAWALRRLAERYSSPDAQFRPLDGTSIETMQREHWQALASRLSKLDAIIAPMRVAAPTKSTEPQDSSEMKPFLAVRQTQELVHALFAGDPVPPQPAEATTRLLQRVSQLIEWLNRPPRLTEFRNQ